MVATSILVLSVITTPCRATWVADFDSGVGGVVEAMVEYDGSLYAGGQFDSSPDSPVAFVSRWTDLDWEIVGVSLEAAGGVDDFVYDLAVYEGDLYVAGRFHYINSQEFNHIAKYDGTNWSSLDGGMNGDVIALAVYNGELYAGGVFTTAGEVSAHYIAKWNGASWSSVGDGLNERVWIMEVFDGKLYAGGVFTLAGNNPAERVASWDGTEWAPLGSGVDNYVHSMTVWNDQLVVGGRFTTAGENPAGRTALWDGGGWTPMGTLNDRPYSLHTYRGKVVAGGQFTIADGLPMSHVARWNGAGWEAMESGIDGPVSELITLGDDLIVGGRFSSASGLPAANIVRWVESPSDVGDSWTFGTAMVAYPNPVVSGALRLALPQASQGDGRLALFDVSGRTATVRDFSAGEAIEVDTSDLPAGVYSVVWSRVAQTPIVTKVVVTR
ncbi:MAG: T9SS type A sorting domain-containing protein [Candidatus Eisenbacteria bacterium]|uniref:T9SS type A sorting domain-containing protein n=1 Tax=Eiseniibacteriota bacterium TaxID=2212470 RepID=A0A956M1J4_UNCEI|nr:T9SS type A sorting domain-containing protein [Candidatus Eisenbacteria bacterium]